MKSLSSLNLVAILLYCSAGVFIGLSVYTFYYAQGASYLSNEPKACVNCHIMREQYDGWQKASHHAVATCNDCHIPHRFIPKYLAKLKNGFWHSKGFTFQDFHEPIRIHPKNRITLQKNCLYCHGELVSEIATYPGDNRRMLDCIPCHRNVGHGPTQ
ncbi:MAG: cytochrome c nitrite reductase small subunit [Candidatus Jettenia sp. CY-1]|nr:cytochrome c nitrite reductase small subunit [Candidatus Jettenia sp.]WKZ19771.1 MAG: cytochrome c nitrite reductase small subunit [Candidatus Jettenia sp. CY-1]